MTEMTARAPTVRTAASGRSRRIEPGVSVTQPRPAVLARRCRSSLARGRRRASTSTCRSCVRSSALVLLARRCPTLVLAPPGRLPQRQLASRGCCYAFGASLLALIVGRAPAQPVLPVVGVDHPLAPLPLALTWLAIDARPAGLAPEHRAARRVLLAHAGPPRAATPASSWRRRWLSVRWSLAVVGAVRLNNGAGGGVALARPGARGRRPARADAPARGQRSARDVRVLVLVADRACCSRPRCAAGRSPATTSRPSSSPSGSPTTPSTGRWARCENAYNACLSVNILPTVLAQTTGLSGELVFKVLLQLVFALVPVLTFLLLAPLPVPPPRPGRRDLHDGVPDVLHRHALPGAPGDRLLLPRPAAAGRDRAGRPASRQRLRWWPSSASASCCPTTRRPT